MLERLSKEKRDKPVYVVSSDTLIENPIILEYLKDNIDKINKSAKELDLPIIAQIVYPELNNSFWANVIGKGYPTPKSIQYRWCTERLKIRPSNTFIKEKLEYEDVVVLLGVRKDESSARKARIEKVKKMLNENLTKEAIEYSKANTLSGKVCNGVLKTKSVYLILLFGKALWWIQNDAKGFYEKIKK